MSKTALSLVLVGWLIASALSADEPSDMKALRSSFPRTRLETTGKQWHGAVSQAGLAAAETIYGGRAVYYGYQGIENCAKQPSAWKALTLARFGKNAVQWAAGAAAVGDAGLRAYVYFHLDADPTVSPLLKLMTGQDMSGHSTLTKLSDLSDEDRRIVYAQQIGLGVGVDGGGTYLLNKYCPVPDPANANQLKASSANVAHAKSQLAANGERIASLQHDLNKLKGIYLTEVGKNGSVTVPTLSHGPDAANGVVEKITFDADKLARATEAYETNLAAALKSKASLAARVRQATTSHFKLMGRFAFTKVGGRALMAATKWVGDKFFVIDFLGRVYAIDSLGVDPKISWVIVDAVPKTADEVSTIISDGWDKIGEPAAKTISAAADRTKNQFMELWDGKKESK